MKHVVEQSKPQERWNSYGVKRLRTMRAHPDRYVLSELPEDHQEAYQDVKRALGSLENKKVLDLGCGVGELSVFLAKQGALVTGIDIGRDLIAAATLLAEINHVTTACTFSQVNVVNLPFAEESYDLVMGISLLHHLSEADLGKTLRDTYRVLKAGGLAVFSEPVENSRLFDFLQNLIPVGRRSTPGYRPSILRRQAWREYLASADDRPLTSQELLLAGEHFASVQLRPVGFVIRLERLLGRGSRGMLTALDTFLLEKLPMTGYLARRVCVQYRK